MKESAGRKKPGSTRSVVSKPCNLGFAGFICRLFFSSILVFGFVECFKCDMRLRYEPSWFRVVKRDAVQLFTGHAENFKNRSCFS